MIGSIQYSLVFKCFYNNFWAQIFFLRRFFNHSIRKTTHLNKITHRNNTKIHLGTTKLFVIFQIVNAMDRLTWQWIIFVWCLTSKILLSAETFTPGRTWQISSMGGDCWDSCNDLGVFDTFIKRKEAQMKLFRQYREEIKISPSLLAFDFAY